MVIVVVFLHIQEVSVPPTANAVPPPFCFAKKRDRNALFNDVNRERGNPPPFRPNCISLKTQHPNFTQCYDLPNEEWSPSLCLRTGMIGLRKYFIISSSAHFRAPTFQIPNFNCRPQIPKLASGIWRLASKKRLALSQVVFLNPTQRRG